MNKKSRFYTAGFVAILLILGILCASCSLILSSDDNENLSDTKTASVYFSLNGNLNANSRSALPSVQLESYLYTIKAKNQSTAEDKILASELKLSQLSNQKFTIERAKWVFSVLAYLISVDEESGEETVSTDAIFEGKSAEIDLGSKANAVVNMALKATTVGTGAVEIPVTFSSKGVKKVTCGLYDSPTGGNLLEGKELQTYSGDDITYNGDGTYTITFIDDEVPSGKSVYARFILYDENDVPVGYYTESVYVAKNQKSKPVIYLKNDDGTYQTDAKGNPVQDIEATCVEVETNQFPVQVTADEGKKVYAETTIIGSDGEEKTLLYELYDEDDDGVYDTVLPPGNYSIKIGENGEDPENAETVEGASVDVNTTENKHSIYLVKNSYTLSYDDSELPIKMISGEELKSSKLSIAGLKDRVGKTVNNAIVRFIPVATVVLTASKTVTVKISAPGYLPIEKSLYVEVRAASPDEADIPELLDGGEALPLNTIQFDLEDDDIDKYEYSFDEENWEPLTEDLIVVQNNSDSILVRTQETGTAEETGYVAPSDAVSISIQNKKGTREDLKSVVISTPVKVAVPLTITVTNDADESVTLPLTYQWYTAVSATSEETDWQIIEGAGSASYSPVVADLGKYLAVKVRYTEKSEKYVSAITQSPVVKGILDISSLSVSYTEVPVAETGTLSNENLAITGALKNSAGAEITVYSKSIPTAPLAASASVNVIISAAGYEDATIPVFVTVKVAAPETYPLLRTDVDTISVGYVAFTLGQNDENKYQYSLDGENWITLTSEQIEVPDTLNSISLRLIASGTAGQNGYIAPSDGVTVEITTENRGTKPAIKGISISVGGDISITTTTTGDVVVLTASEGYTDYTWTIDGESATSVTGTSIEATAPEKLTLNKASWNPGEYRIELTAMKNGFIYNAFASVSISE